jgi:hypothetical protein
MTGFLNPVRKARAFVRWIGRNPPLRLARLAARDKRVRVLALITQSLWLTPDLLASMRPMRKWGYVLGCLAVATGLWADVAMNMAPDTIAIGARRMGEIGTVTGLWNSDHGAAVLFILFQLSSAAVVVLMAAMARLDLGVARLVSRLFKIPAPRRLGFRYFLLLMAGDIATLFAITWVLLKMVSPSGLATLGWMDRHPWLGAPLFAILALAYVGGFILWQLALRERGRQIYGEGRRPFIYNTASLVVSITTCIGAYTVLRSLGG